MARQPVGLVEEFLAHLEHEKQQSPNTVRAYGRDLAAFTDFMGRHQGTWTWASVDRLAIRGFLGELPRKGLARPSAARATLPSASSTSRVISKFRSGVVMPQR